MKFPRWELRHCADPLDTRAYKGGGGGTSSTSNQTTVNTDRRSVLDDSVAVGDGSTSSVTMNTYTEAADAEVLKYLGGAQSDAITAIVQGGATVMRDMGGAIVDLNRDSIAANSKAWDSTLEYGAASVDAQIDLLSKSFGIASENVKAGTSLAEKAIAAFTPTENKNADIGKYAFMAAAAVAAAVLLKGSK